MTANGLVDPEITVDLSDYLALCGKAVEHQFEQDNYQVSRDTLRRVAYALEDHNALYIDEDFAKQTRWDGVIAMPGYLYAHCPVNYALHLGTITDSAGLLFDLADNMGADWEFCRPVRPGDTILVSQKPVGAVVKRGPRLGLFALLTAESRFVNQHGELVATVRQHNARWSSKRAAEIRRMAAVYGTARVAPDNGPRDEPMRITDMAAPKPRRYDHHNVFFEDVEAGTRLVDLQLGPLSALRLDDFRVAIGSFARWSTSPIVSGGHVPTKYAEGILTVPWFGSMLTRWAGPNAWVRKLSYQNREWMLAGYTYFARGTIAKKSIGDGRAVVECDIRMESDTGILTRTGSAVVELLRRG